MALTTLAGKGSALSHAELDANWTELDLRTQAGWKDMIAPLTVEGLTENAAVFAPFGPSGNRAELRFVQGSMAYCKPFHVNHDVKPGGKALVHVHWTTNGSSTGNVRWAFEIMRARGFAQEYFGGEVNIYVEQPAWGGAWRHMVAEVDITDALTLTEPDELILITLRRCTCEADDNPDHVYALMVDLHYEADRDSTPNRAPDFYVP
jgi:hypothetical protein